MSRDREGVRWRAYRHRRFVYFVACGEFVKIGRSACLAKRLRALQTANPHPLELLNVVDAVSYPEREFHERFDAIRARGEWFHRTVELESLAQSYRTAGLKVVDWCLDHYPVRRTILPDTVTAFVVAEIASRLVAGCRT